MKTLREILSGSKFSLIDADAVEDFSFPDEGDHLPATLGTRSGAVCAPVLRYHITAEGKVEIFSGPQLLYTWEEIEVHGDIATVRCGQGTKRFRYSREGKRSRGRYAF